MLLKLFFSTFLASTTLFTLLIFSANYSIERESQIQTLTQLTTLPGITLSTGYLEPRVIYYKDFSNQLYSEMKNYSKMDYVYAQ